MPSRAALRALLALGLAAGASALTQHSRMSSLMAEAESLESEKERPVAKVVRLLTEMRTSIEKEAAADEELFEKQACWCKTNQRDKEESIAGGEARDRDLVAEIEQRAGRDAELETQLKALAKQINADENALKEAESLRAKGLTSFRGEEKDLVLAIANLRNALTVLGKHHESLLQSGSSAKAALLAGLRHATDTYEFKVGAYASLAAGELRSKVFRALAELEAEGKGEAFLQASTGAGARLAAEAARSQLDAHYAGKVMEGFLQRQPHANAGSYNARSGQIFGILKNMRTDFEKKLKELQEGEVRAVEAYGELKASKSEGLDAMKGRLDEKKQELAGNAKKLSDAKEDLEETRSNLAADRKFLTEIKLQCQASDKDYEARQKVRSEELTAVSEAIVILTDDDAKDTFNRNFNFLQTAAAQKAQRAQAAALLRAARARTDPVWDSAAAVLADASASRVAGKTDLAAVETMVQLDAFTKVKEAIDQMVSELKQQQATEVEEKDWCKGQLNDNAKERQEKKHTHEDLVNKIGDLELTMKRLNEEVETLHKEIAAMEVEIKRSGEQREAQNAEYQATVADQRATKEILTKALKRLEAFYAEKKKEQAAQAAAALLEEPGKAPEAMPLAQKYKKSQGATGVLSMLEMVIEETATEEAAARKSEADAQAAYEEFVKSSNAGIKGRQEAIVTKTEARAEAEEALEAANGDRVSTEEELAKLTDYKAQLHAQCDYLVKNFDLRQQARSQEMEALSAAKAILSGAKVDEDAA